MKRRDRRWEFEIPIDDITEAQFFDLIWLSGFGEKPLNSQFSHLGRVDDLCCTGIFGTDL